MAIHIGGRGPGHMVRVSLSVPDFVSEPWDGVTRFTASKGINEPPLGFDDFAPWSNANLWSNWMSATRWSSLLTQTTADHIRVCIDPTPMLRAANNASQMVAYLAMVKGAVDDVLARGLKAIVDMHVSRDATYGDAALCAAYPSGDAWTRVRSVWRAVTILLNQYDTDKVAFEVWNESFSDKAKYTALLPDLVAYLRSVVGYKTTFIVMPWNGTYDTSINPTFAASQFGANCGFAHHMYIPGIFTHQGQAGANHQHYVHNLPFPVTTDQRAAFISAATAEINADNSLSSAQKAEFNGLIATDINYYFDNFAYTTDYDGAQAVTDAIGAFFQEFGSRNPGSPGAGAGLEKWRVANGVAASQIFITEFGVHRDYDVEGANQEDAVRWFSVVSKYLNVQGLARTVWDDFDSYFSIRANPGPVGSITAATPFDTQILQAIGMYREPPFDTVSLPGLALLHRKNGYTAGTGTWDDISPINRDSVQATAGSRPTANTTEGGITTTSTQKIPSTLPADPEIEYGWAVITIPVLTGSNKSIIGSTDGSGNSGRQIAVNTSGGIVMNRQGQSQQIGTGSGRIVAGQKQLVEWIRQRSTTLPTQIWVDAVQSASGTVNDAYAAGMTSFIGGRQSGENFVGSIHEIGSVQGNIPDAATRAKVQGRVAWDHGIQGRLPAAHPYKAMAPA